MIRPVSIFCVLVGGCLAAVSISILGSSHEPDPLAKRGYAVTSGAAPGYVEDRVCGSCHTDLYRSYQEVSMSQAFYRAQPEKVIEDFQSSHFYHHRSQRWYDMALRDGRYFFRRYQLDLEDRPINVFEQEVDWILGSGSHARTYLYRTPGGELFQLPIAWYSQTASWGMAPGYDRRDHNGVTRQVRRECMFCHNAFPDIPAGNDAYDAPHTYPEQLPEGLGCQRCHGPGAEHSRIGMSDAVDFERLASSIINPANLSPELQRDICYGCHMQPAVAVDSVRRFGRGDFSFRPGESLADYQVHVDVEEQGRSRLERFEINHHPYRLEQSRCFIASQQGVQNGTGRKALSCTTCHDPHQKVPETARKDHYRAVCESCHSIDACLLPGMVEAGQAAVPAVDLGECVACHMQERRPQDAAGVTMTDHLIRRVPAGEERLAPLEEEAEPVVVDVHLLSPKRAPAGRGEIYRAAAAVRAGGGGTAVDWLQTSLAAAAVSELDPHLDVARGHVEGGRYKQVEPILADLLSRSPEHPWLLEWSAITTAGLGRPMAALETLRRAVGIHPERPRLRLQLGRLLTGLGQPKDALPHLQRVLKVRPNMVKAHLYLGDAFVALERHTEAVDSFRRALEIEPSRTGSYLALARALQASGDSSEALRWLRHGTRVADRPEALQEALAFLSGVP